jgi:hypothetical protein
MKKLYFVVFKLVQILQVYCDYYCTVRKFVISVKAVALFARNLSVHIENSTRCNSVSKFYFIFI